MIENNIACCPEQFVLVKGTTFITQYVPIFIVSYIERVKYIKFF